MKGDFTRRTFEPRKHYASVQMQQGRVQLDADWNEQAEIQAHRIEAEAVDLIGRTGGSSPTAGFHIVEDIEDLSDEERRIPGNREARELEERDFYISAGRYYVDGILCENDAIVRYVDQGEIDLPDPPEFDHAPYLVYLDVWRRHLTHLEDPGIREVALGGPDTATRVKTVWQVKLFETGADVDCSEAFRDFLASRPEREGRLAFRAVPPQGDTEPCVLPPSAGYRGLENQLYRVEVHAGGEPLDIGSAVSFRATLTPATGHAQLEVVGGIWESGRAVEVFRENAEDPISGELAHIELVEGARLTLDRSLPASFLGDRTRIRVPDATYKWSRDNGTVVTAVLKIDGNEITVSDLGPDEVLGFAAGQWVELSDDALELNGRPGYLAMVREVNARTNVITLETPMPALGSDSDGIDPVRHPRLRRWDGIGAVKLGQDNGGEDLWAELEDGVQVRFAGGFYEPGDFWQVPARSATEEAASGSVQWPLDATGEPLLLEPAGIEHHYAPLALLEPDEGGFDMYDCRDLFPPLTELESLFYVAGDGQSVAPDPKDPDLALPLPLQLIVGVARGSRPVPGALVRFQVIAGGGELSGGSELLVETDVDGQAMASWSINGLSDLHTVRSDLVARDADGDLHELHIPILFHATLSMASAVAYFPQPDCPELADAKTVQEAIDLLCDLPRGAGGGCCTTVGKGGEFDSIKEALAGLFDRGERNVCLCLLPGDHEFPDVPLTKENLDTLSLHGTRGATRIVANAIAAQSVQTLSLHDLEIASKGQAVLFAVDNATWLTIEGCMIRSQEAPVGGVALSIKDTNQVTLRDSTIVCQTTATNPELDLKARLPREVLEIVMSARTQPPDVTRALLQRLAALPVAERRRISRGVETATTGVRRFTAADNPTLDNLRDLLGTDAAPNLGALVNLASALSRLGASARAGSGAAIVFQDGLSRSWVDACVLRGALVLYGPITEQRLNVDLVAKMRVMLKERPLVTKGGELRLTGNRMQELLVGEVAVKAILESNPDAMVSFFKELVVSNNTFSSMPNEFLAENVVASSNSFLGGSENGGGSVANSQTFVGNLSSSQTTINVAHNGMEIAANLRIRFN